MKLIKQDGVVVELDPEQESFESCREHVEGYVTLLAVGRGLVFLLDEDAGPKQVGPNFAATTMLQALNVNRSDTLLGPVVVLGTPREVRLILG